MQILQLYLYPIKSLPGIPVEEAVLSRRGFQYDRRWMIVDADGLFITQRTFPTLSQIKVALNNKSFHLFTETDRNGVHIPIEPDAKQPMEQVEIWGTTCPAITGFVEASTWLSKQVAAECRLVFMPDATERFINSPLVPTDSIVSFADGYPYLLIGTASLEDLNNRLEEAVGFNRFRPNIVVNTNAPFEEDTWGAFQIGNISFTAIKACARCIIINVNPETAIHGKQPLRTLAGYRLSGKKILFGQYVLWNNNGKSNALSKTIRIGDPLKIVSKK